MSRHALSPVYCLFFLPVLLSLVQADEVVVKERSAAPQVLLSAEVHEAYAAPDNYFTEVPAPASKIPPADLVEKRPAISAELEQQMVWIPGYWKWNAPDESFTWTAGLWRFPPPHRRWHPGGWVRTDDGYVRSPGRWIPGTRQEIVFVDAPPRYRGALLLDDSLPAGQFWVPGCWTPAADGKFTWREGYVSQQRENWVWVPAQYSWTPKGWLFVDGYWDYPLNARGQSFASLKWSDVAYDASKIQIENLAPVPNTAIVETDNGEYVYQVDAFDDEYQFVSVTRTDAIPDAPVAIVGELPARPLATVKGVIHRGALTPANIEVELLGEVALGVKTNEQGAFEFRDVPFGVYHIRAAGPVQNHVKRAIGRLVVNKPVVNAQMELQ